MYFVISINFKISKYEKLGKSLLYCIWHHTITTLPMVRATNKVWQYVYFYDATLIEKKMM